MVYKLDRVTGSDSEDESLFSFKREPLAAKVLLLLRVIREYIRTLEQKVENVNDC